MGYFGSGGGGASEREQMVPKRGPVRPTRSYACEGVLIFFDILDLLDFSSSSKYWNILMEPRHSALQDHTNIQIFECFFLIFRMV